MGTIAAFFDLDGTLIAQNSALLWAKHERRAGNISRWQLARAGIWSALYHLSLIDIETAYAEATRHYRGQSHEALQARTNDWFRQEVAPQLRAAARQAMAEHRSRGHRLVILTSSSRFEASIAAQTWGFDDWLANHFPTDDQGRLTGSYRRPLCYGPGKVLAAEQWAQDHDAELGRSFFYTDSYSDLPMLMRVGEPRVVSPDPRLRLAAKRRGWPVLEW